MIFNAELCLLTAVYIVFGLTNMSGIREEQWNNVKWIHAK